MPHLRSPNDPRPRRVIGAAPWAGPVDVASSGSSWIVGPAAAAANVTSGGSEQIETVGPSCPRNSPTPWLHHALVHVRVDSSAAPSATSWQAVGEGTTITPLAAPRPGGAANTGMRAGTVTDRGLSPIWAGQRNRRRWQCGDRTGGHRP